MRLIDADALLKTLTVFDEKYTLQKSDVFHHIENAPTVQREGWVSVPIEPTREMLMAGCEAGLDIKTLMDDEPFSTDKAVYKAMINAYIKNRS